MTLMKDLKRIDRVLKVYVLDQEDGGVHRFLTALRFYMELYEASHEMIIAAI